MNYQGQDRETEEMQAALRHFRASVHEWSEQEFGRARVVRRSRWDAVARVAARPVVGWAMAGVLAVASVGVRVAVHRERQLQAERKLVLERQQEMEAKTVEQQKATAMNDDELMSHVDSDIAQAAPDAMLPLASLMSDSTSK